MGLLQLDSKQKGLNFDGVNDYVATTFARDISLDTSFAFLINLKSNANQRIMASYAGGSLPAGGFVIAFDGTFGIYFGLYSSILGTDTCSIYTTIPPSLGLNHIVVVKETQTRDNWKIYVNGVSVGVTNFGANNVASGGMSGNSILIGMQNNPTPSFFLNADFLDAKIFNKALTASEVLDLYNNTSVPSGLIADYRFDNKSGFILTDYQGGNNGTLTNYTAGDVTIGDTNKWLYEFGGAYDAKRIESGILPYLMSS